MRLEVLAGGDTVRQERLTRTLHEKLAETDGIAVEFAVPQAAPAGDGRKAGITADVILWVTVAASARPASQLLITAIKEWCATERHRKVLVTHGERSIEISGRPDEAQERLVREFLRDADESH
ncbi:effector-associated constant component EACC1 [Streptosporangium lutulentum]|uniref:Uncharacterized protein n=1 Tax=Streptosporangium lutulentum TaxID=1461250 RepID=A0ABT9QTR5_9ACTN|nr:hypothetical protein [Streptosporangium lutulentum]MDP9849786.1 hypothetical protein [Streptosporangium lutulentum]